MNTGVGQPEQRLLQRLPLGSRHHDYGWPAVTRDGELFMFRLGAVCVLRQVGLQVRKGPPSRSYPATPYGGQGVSRNPRKARPTPTRRTRVAVSAGSAAAIAASGLRVPERCDRAARRSSRPRRRTSRSPATVRVTAIPRPYAITRKIPKTVRPKAIEATRTMRADGLGTNPPATPIPISPPRPTARSCVWPPAHHFPPCSWPCSP